MRAMIGWVVRYAWVLVAAAFVTLLTALGAQTVRLKSAQKQTSEVRAMWAADREQANAAALEQATAYRAEEQRRIAAQKETIDESERQITAARADAVDAGVAAQRLRQRVAALVAANRRATENPAAVGTVPAAGDAIGVFADLLGRADARAGILGEYADRARIAGQSCEREYDALKR